jgi:hypothetical protein
MQKLVYFLFLIALSLGASSVASAQIVSSGGSGVGGSAAIACVGTPGNTLGAYRQQCQTTAGVLYVCNNAAGCTVAADWVAAGGTAGPGYSALPSTSSITIPAPGSLPTSVSYTIAACGAYGVGALVQATVDATPADYIQGNITSCAGTTMVINATSVGGSGTFATWHISLVGNPGPNTASVPATFLAGATTGSLVHNFGTASHVDQCWDSNGGVFPSNNPLGTNTDSFQFATALANDTTCVSSTGGGAGSGGSTFPLTVAGTVISGGVAYFNSTTQESSSALLAANRLLLGGGAGGAPTSDSKFDDGATTANTLTYTGSGGAAITGGPITVGSGPATAWFTGTSGLFGFSNGTCTGTVPASSGFLCDSAGLPEWLTSSASNSLMQASSTSTTTTQVAIVTATAGVYAPGAITTGMLPAIPLSGLAAQAADTVVLNATGSTASPTAVAMPTSGTNGCAGAANAVTYNTTTHAFGCNSISTASSALSAITAATGANTIASGNFGLQIWNWTPTTNQVQIQFGETGASTNGTLGNQYIAKFVTLAGSTAVPVNITSSLTGTQTLPTLHVTPTWNVGSAVVDAGILENVTNTASGATSKLIDLQVGGTTEFNVDTLGNTAIAGAAKIGSSPPTCTAGTGGAFCLAEGTNTTAASSVDQLVANSTLHDFAVLANGGVAKLLSSTVPYNSGSISASVGSTNIASSANFPTGQYRLDCDVVVTAVGATPTLATTVGWTDISGTARTKTCTTGVITVSDNPTSTTITSNGSAAITVTQTLAVSTATWQTTIGLTRLQ